MAAMQHKKVGEKSQVLEFSWKLLSDSGDAGSVGGVRVTQGIYTKTEGRKLTKFCKRGVYVPDSFSLEQIQNICADFGAVLDPCVSRTSVLGICGKHPTRTAHANDTEFFLLARLHEKFVIIGLVSTDEAYSSVMEIKTDHVSLAEAVKWVREEAQNHLNTPIKKRGKYNKKKQDDGSEGETDSSAEVDAGVRRPREEEEEYEESYEESCEESLEPSPKRPEYIEDFRQLGSAVEEDSTPASTEIAGSLFLGDNDSQSPLSFNSPTEPDEPEPEFFADDLPMDLPLFQENSLSDMPLFQDFNLDEDFFM